jgi:hypothetical protein|tara:strand:+ start:548 stop:796 length:249 start_codon:yes stop_codon:yes gene_type:complete
MDDEFEMGGTIVVQNDGKTIQEHSVELAITLILPTIYAAYEKQITAEELAFKVVDAARVFEAYLDEGYENQPEADIVSLREV